MQFPIFVGVESYRYRYESKPWYPSEPQITGKWMFIPPNIARLVLIHPHMVAEIDPHVTHGVSHPTWLAFSPRIVERLAVPRPLSLERSLEIFLKAVGSEMPMGSEKGLV